MKKLLSQFASNCSGATAIEYALIASIVSIGIIGALYQIQPLMEANFTDVKNAFAQ